MKKLLMIIALTITVNALAETETIGDYTWSYRITDDGAEIYSWPVGLYQYAAAISPEPVGIITVPETLGGKPVTRIGDGAFYHCNGLTGVIIPDSVKSVGFYAFDLCEALAFDCNSIPGVRLVDGWVVGYTENLPYIDGLPLNDVNLTGARGIADGAFYECLWLNSVIIPTSVKSVGGYSFFHCFNLNSLTVPSALEYDYEGRYHWAFTGCTNLTSLTVTPASETATFGAIGFFALDSFVNIANIVIQDGVKNIGDWAFAYRGGSISKVTSITIPNSVTNIGAYAFSDTSLASVTIGNSVISIGDYAFSGCGNIRDLIIPASVKRIGSYAFAYCGGLRSITIPDGVTSINEATFACCRDLTSVTIPNSVTNIGAGAFSNCRNLTSVTIPDGVTSVENYAFEYCSDLTSVTIPNSVKNIGAYAFNNCRSLTSVTIPMNVDSIDVYAFSDCTSLEQVNVPSRLKYYIEEYGEDIFAGSDVSITYYNTAVLTLNANGGETPKPFVIADVDGTLSELPDATKDGYAFGGWFTASEGGTQVFPYTTILQDTEVYAHWLDCTIQDGVLTGINLNGSAVVVLPKEITSIGDSVFYGANAVTRIGLPEGLKSIGATAFYHCWRLNDIAIPNSVTNIGQAAFDDCSSITEIVVPDGVTRIGSCTFRDCSALTNVIIGAGVSYIGEQAFFRCNAALYDTSTIEGVQLVDGWAVGYTDDVPQNIDLNGIKGVGYGAFRGCGSISAVIVPKETRSIGDTAFEDSGLTRAYLPESLKDSFSWDVFSGCPSGFSIIYYEGETPSFDNVATISFDANGGSVAYESAEFMVGCPFVSLPKATKPGLSFEGWFTEPEGGEEITEETVASESMTVYAHWGDLHCEFTIVNGELRGVELNGETEITIPAGVTSIGQYAFSGCAGLVSVTIPEGVTNIGYAAFYRCSGLMRIYLPRSLRFIRSEAFDYCYNIQELRVADIAAWCAVSIDGVYAHPLASNSWGSGRIYEGEELLSQLAIPSGVGSVGAYAFYGCGSLTSVTMPESCGSIGTGAFRLCRSLESVETGDGVTIIGEQAFYACSALSYVDLGSNVVSIGADAFYNCDSLAEIIIPDSVTTIGSRAFQYCYQLSRISFMGNAPTVGSDAFRFSYYTSTDYVGLVRRDSTGWHVFEGMKWKGALTLLYEDDLTPVDDGGPVTEYFITDGVLVGVDLDGATSATIPDGVTSIGDEAFRGCEDLTSVVIPNSVISIGNSAFYNCYRLTDVTMTGGLTSIGNWAFGSCALTSVAMPDSVTNIGEYAFYECSHMTNSIIPNGILSIENGAFYGCRGLKSVEIPGSVTSIGEAAFEYCSSLEDVSIPDGVASLDNYAFYGCYKLESVTLGNGLTRIGNYVFSGCENLKTAYVPIILDIDIDAVFYGSSQDLEIIYTGEYVECTVTFNANGGSVDETERIRASGKRMGSLPEITRDGYLFAGWFTAAKGGDLVTAETIVTSDMTVYAQWQKAVVVPVATFESTGGDANWTYADGVWCSGDIEDDQNTWAQISVTGPCHVSFSWKASSESVSYDYLYITVDGIEAGSEDRIGGETDWIAKIISIGASSHYVRWTYKKDSSVSSGSDCAWLKDVVIIKPEDAEPASVPTVEVSEKMEAPVEQGGKRVIAAKEGQALTEDDVDTVIISSPLDSSDITEAYVKTLVDNQIIVELATPEVESVEEEEEKVEDDPSGMLVEVEEKEISAKPTPEAGEAVGALPVKAYPGLYYQASWGDDLNSLTTGEKVQATGDSLYLGVIKQKGDKGFYKLSVSEK